MKKTEAYSTCHLSTVKRHNGKKSLRNKPARDLPPRVVLRTTVQVIVLSGTWWMCFAFLSWLLASLLPNRMSWTLKHFHTGIKCFRWYSVWPKVYGQPHIGNKLGINLQAQQPPCDVRLSIPQVSRGSVQTSQQTRSVVSRFHLEHNYRPRPWTLHRLWLTSCQV